LIKYNRHILKRNIHILLFLLACLPAIAQNYAQNALLNHAPEERGEISPSASEIFNYIDERVSKINSTAFLNYDQLAKFLAEGYTDDKSKVRSIYTWIASNIKYDQRAYDAGKAISSQGVAEIWKSHVAVCEGYANLFNAMCRAVGIESRMIKGYVRDFTGKELTFPNHAWNSVMISGKWQLVDVTWASINNDANTIANEELTDLYSKHKLNYFFLVDPRQMILTHLPEDPYWQLQSNYIDLVIFEEGENAVEDAMKNKFARGVNFEKLISSYELLDSLDRSISYLERMETGKNNKIKEYGLGIGYYYKAQEILNSAEKDDQTKSQKAKEKALIFYRKSLDQLSRLTEKDFGYEFSRDLANNVSFRMEVLQ
jgi:exonuclease VII small subunit